MKKLFLFLMACSLSLTMSAKVAYLIPIAQRVNQDCQECDLPYEACDNGEQSPERRAFKWFRDEYTGEKTILYLNDLANIPADVNAIWIHVDRVGFSTAAFDAVFTSEVKANLQAFVNRGGNVFLAKQATRLEYDLVNAKHFSDDNRAELDYGDGGYVGAQTWGASILFYATNNDDDNNNHRVWGSYANHAMFKNAPHRSDSYLEYVWSDGKQITDHNSGFPIGQMNMNGTDWRLELWGFQQKNNCRVIGGWANGVGCHYGGIVEFYPTASRKGTVVMLGLAAYQWINNNAGNGFDNVKKSTEDLLKYLDNKNVKGRNLDKLMTDIFAEDWCYPASLETENHAFRIVHPNIDGWTMSSWIPEDQRSIADIRYIERSADDKHDRIEFYQEGTVDLHIKLTEDREFQAWPKGDYEFVRKVTFSYSSSAQTVANEDLSSNGLDGETGKFMVLHPNMRGLDSLEYVISFDGIEEANRAEVQKVKDGAATRLVFTKAGTVKLNIRLNEANFREEWAKGEHSATKTITFAEPAFTWSHVPDQAALNEDKPVVVVTCDNVPGATVKYESSDPTIAAVNAETGKISYIKEGTTQINAYIEINGVKFESDKRDVTVNGLNIIWTTAPAETAKVGETMEIAAAPEYGSATVLYEVSNCSYDSETGEISFAHSGTATIRPYAIVNENPYYGEMKSIAVSPDLKWTTEPQSAFVGELNKKAVASTNEGTIVYSSSDESRVTVDNEGNLTFLGYETAADVTITATVTINEQDYTISGVLHANLPSVEWQTLPSETAYNGEVMAIEAQLKYWAEHKVLYETENCSYDAETGMLTITAGGTATVRPYVVLSEHNYYGETKSIAVTTPVVTWSQLPGDAAVMETKDAAQATCNIDALTVYYRSLNTDVIEIDATTGAMTYKAPSDEEGAEPYQGVVIEAYVTVGEGEGALEFKTGHETKVYTPKADWVTRPETTATIGEDMTIAAKVRYGAATLGFECTGCTYSDGKLHFTTVGTATVRPYAQAYGNTYYNNEEGMGELITITVSYAEEHPAISMETIPAKVWDLFPVTLPETLDGYAVTYTVNNANATLAGNVLTYAGDGEVELTATYTETNAEAQWPAGDHTYTKTITMAGYGEAASGVEIAYLLPESLDALAAIEEKAEYNAAKWFMDNYIGAEKNGKFVRNLNDLTGIKTLWINIERVGITTDYAVLSDNAALVESFVKAGGNVLLTKQATQLAYTSGRMPLAPNFEANDYFVNETDATMYYRERSITTNMGIGADADKDMSEHRIYNLMLYWDGPKNVYMVAPDVNKTNNYCGWQDMHKNVEKTDKAINTKIACLNEFETAWGCQVLGIKGHIVDYCYADVVDFAPMGEYTGRILAVGSSAYQWGESNRTAAANDAKEYRNVVQFTKNALAYLQNEEMEEMVYERAAMSGYFSTICYPFEISAVDGAKVYEIACLTQNARSIMLEEVNVNGGESMQAGRPYIFMPEQSVVRFTYSGSFVESVDNHNGLVGNLNTTAVSLQINDYFLYYNEVVHVDMENLVEVPQYRAYIRLADIPGYVAPATPEAAARRRMVSVRGVATDLENTEAASAAEKRMENGQLVIIRDGLRYNAQGMQF